MNLWSECITRLFARKPKAEKRIELDKFAKYYPYVSLPLFEASTRGGAPVIFECPLGEWQASFYYHSPAHIDNTDITLKSLLGLKIYQRINNNNGRCSGYEELGPQVPWFDTAAMYRPVRAVDIAAHRSHNSLSIGYRLPLSEAARKWLYDNCYSVSGCASLAPDHIITSLADTERFVGLATAPQWLVYIPCTLPPHSPDNDSCYYIYRATKNI